MKLNEILTGELDLSTKPNPQLVKILRKGDRIKYMGEGYTVAIPLRKGMKGQWLITLESTTGNRERLYLEYNSKPTKMTGKEKRVMLENIQGNLKNFDGQTSKLVTMCRSYYENLVELNNYRSEDVREVIQNFGSEILSLAGIRF